MKKESTQKKFVALFATVCAFVLLLVGIPFAAAPASAAETPEIQPMIEPCNCGVGVSFRERSTAVIVTYTGHTANCTMYAESKCLFLGSNINPFYGQKVVDNPYTEVCVPVVNSQHIPVYPWMRPSLDVENHINYQTHHIFGGQTSISNLPVTDSIVSGWLNAGVEQEFTIPSSFDVIQGCCVYDGYVSQFSIESGSNGDSKSIDSNGDGKDDITFTIRISGTKLYVKSNKTIQCSSRVGQGSGFGAFSFNVQV